MMKFFDPYFIEVYSGYVRNKVYTVNLILPGVRVETTLHAKNHARNQLHMHPTLACRCAGIASS